MQSGREILSLVIGAITLLLAIRNFFFLGETDTGQNIVEGAEATTFLVVSALSFVQFAWEISKRKRSSVISEINNFISGLGKFLRRMSFFVALGVSAFVVEVFFDHDLFLVPWREQLFKAITLSIVLTFLTLLATHVFTRDRCNQSYISDEDINRSFMFFHFSVLSILIFGNSWVVSTELAQNSNKSPLLFIMNLLSNKPIFDLSSKSLSESLTPWLLCVTFISIVWAATMAFAIKLREAEIRRELTRAKCEGGSDNL